MTIQSIQPLIDRINTVNGIEECAGLMCDQVFLTELLKLRPHEVDVVAEAFKRRGYAKGAFRSCLKDLRKTHAETQKTSYLSALGDEWTRELTLLKDGRLAGTLGNAQLIVNNAIVFKDLFQCDNFNMRLYLTREPPWECPKQSFPAEIDDNDVVGLTVFLEHEFKIVLLVPQVYQAVIAAAKRNAVDPLVAYLELLDWDGKDRLDHLMPVYFSTEPTRLNCEYGKRFMIQAAARALSPACKAEAVLVLEGEEGLYKSTALEILASTSWFSAEMINPSSKELPYQLHGKWIVEIREFESFRSSSPELAKGFIDRQFDRHRPVWERAAVDQPRRCVFTATTNESQYLYSTTGNRRYWPVRVGCRIDLVGLRADRDQLWAEAVWRFRNGERWWIDESERELIGEQMASTAMRQPEDPWLHVVAGIRDGMTVPDILELLEKPRERQSLRDTIRVNQLLTQLGFVPYPVTHKNGSTQLHFRRASRK